MTLNKMAEPTTVINQMAFIYKSIFLIYAMFTFTIIHENIFSLFCQLK